MGVNISNYKVTYNAVKNPKTRFKESNFGMGFRQIVEDGPNSDEETWDIDFRAMDSTTVLVLEGILLNSVKSSSSLLYWTPPGEETTKYYTAHEVQKTFLSPTLFKLKCTFRREFSGWDRI